MHKPETWAKQARTIRAELVGVNGCHCALAGVYACASNPILEMCHILVAAGYHPSSKLVCFRGGAHSLTVHNIGEAAYPKVSSVDTGFNRLSNVRKSSTMRKARSTPTWENRRPPRMLASRRRRGGKKPVLA